MKRHRSLLGQWLAMSLLYGCALLVLYHETIVDYKYQPTSLEVHNWSDRQPTGEIVAGFVLEQPLALRRTDLPRRERGQPFCIRLLISNYLDRRNEGEFSLTLSIRDRSQMRVVNAANMRDNVWLPVCFNEFSLNDLLGQPATLTLAGVDGKPGRSVTAWLSPQTHLAGARRDGVELDRSLVLVPHIHTGAQAFQRNAYTLLALAAMAMALLTVAAYRRGRS